MDLDLAMEQAFEDLERRLDTLEEKVSMALDQSAALLEYIRNHPDEFQHNRTVTRRIILEETTMLPEPVSEDA